MENKFDRIAVGMLGARVQTSESNPPLSRTEDDRDGSRDEFNAGIALFIVVLLLIYMY